MKNLRAIALNTAKSPFRPELPHKALYKFVKCCVDFSCVYLIWLNSYKKAGKTPEDERSTVMPYCNEDRRSTSF